MDSSSNDAPADAPARRTRPSGRPVEVFIWRVVPGEGRGEHRQLLDNVVPAALFAVRMAWPYGPGRFRLEHRDDKRALAKVEYVDVPDAHGKLVPKPSTGRKAKPRVVGPPRAATTPAPSRPLKTPTTMQRRLEREAAPPTEAHDERPRRPKR